MIIEHTFVSAISSTSKEQEQERSRALAHAARFSHRQRRSTQDGQRYNRAKQRVNLSRNSSVQARGANASIISCTTPDPRSWESTVDCFRSIGLHTPRESREIFSFLRYTFLTDFFLASGGSVSPWISRQVVDLVCGLTLANYREPVSQAAEDLVLSGVLKRATNTVEMHRHYLKCKWMVTAKAQMLQKGLGVSLPTDILMSLVLKLFTAAVCDCDLEQAISHGATLQSMLLQKLNSNGITSIDVCMLSYIIQFDFQIAQLTGSHTIFNIDFWKSKCTTQAMKPIVDFLEPLYQSHTQESHIVPLSASLDCVRKGIHQWLWLWCSRTQNEVLRPFKDTQLVVTYFLLEQALFQAQLNNHFVEVRDEILQDQPLPTDTRFLPLYTDAVATLGLLAYLTTFMSNPKVNGIYTWCKSRVFLSQLRFFLPALINNGCGTHRTAKGIDWAEQQQLECNHVVLFASWIGATWEQRSDIFPHQSPPVWFQSRFRRIACQMGLSGWSNVKIALDRVCVTDYAQPPGSSWVDGALKLQTRL